MSKIIHVCVAADNNYKLPLTAVLNSFVKNVKHQTVLHILYTGFWFRYATLDTCYILQNYDSRDVF